MSTLVVHAVCRREGELVLLDQVTLPKEQTLTISLELPSTTEAFEPKTSLRGRFPQLLAVRSEDLNEAKAMWDRGVDRLLDRLHQGEEH